MIVVDKRKLRFLLAGRTLELSAGREYRKGRDYAVGVNRKQICRATILSCEPAADGFVIRIRQHREVPLKFLARDPGAQRRDYVSEPSKAMLGEHAVLDDETASFYGRLAAHRHLDRERERLGAELDDARRQLLQIRNNQKRSSDQVCL